MRTGTCFIQKIFAPSSSLLQGKHLPFSSSPLRLNNFRLFVILSLTQLYRYTPEIFLFSTATLKYTYRPRPLPPLTNWTRIVSERGLLNAYEKSSANRKWLYPFHWLKILISHVRWLFLSNLSEGGGAGGGRYILMWQSKREIDNDKQKVFRIHQTHRHLFHSKNICPLLFLTSR
jgi:hypothetical protein